MSSATPSEKNSCSESALKFVNRRTAMEGLSANWGGWLATVDRFRAVVTSAANVGALPDSPHYTLRVIGQRPSDVADALRNAIIRDNDVGPYRLHDGIAGQ